MSILLPTSQSLSHSWNISRVWSLLLKSFLFSYIPAEILLHSKHKTSLEISKRKYSIFHSKTRGLEFILFPIAICLSFFCHHHLKTLPFKNLLTVSIHFSIICEDAETFIQPSMKWITASQCFIFYLYADDI